MSAGILKMNSDLKDDKFSEAQLKNLLNEQPEGIVNALKKFKHQFQELSMAEQFLSAVSIFYFNIL